MRPVEGVGVGDGVVESEELYVDEEAVADEGADVDDKIDVVRVIADGFNVTGAGRPGVIDEINVGDGADMAALGANGLVDTDVVVGGTVADDVAVVVEEIDAEVELPIVAARLMPFLSVQQLALVLPQHQVPSPHCLSPMLPVVPCRCGQVVSLRCLFSRGVIEVGPNSRILTTPVSQNPFRQNGLFQVGSVQDSLQYMASTLASRVWHSPLGKQISSSER